MCDPVSATALAAAVGGGMQAYGQYEQGRYQERVMEQNAQVAGAQAEDARQRGLYQEMQVRRGVRQVLGRQRAAMASSGVDLGSGSALDLQAETARLGEEDAYLARMNALREAWGFEVDATGSRAQGRMARRAGNLGAASTLLTSGAQAYGQYRQWT